MTAFTNLKQRSKTTPSAHPNTTSHPNPLRRGRLVAEGDHLHLRLCNGEANGALEVPSAAQDEKRLQAASFCLRVGSFAWANMFSDVFWPSMVSELFGAMPVISRQVACLIVFLFLQQFFLHHSWLSQDLFRSPKEVQRNILLQWM